MSLKHSMLGTFLLISLSGSIEYAREAASYQQTIDEILRAIKVADGYDLGVLGKEDSARAVAVIIEAFNDERWWIRREAVIALNTLNSEVIIEPLVDLLGDEEPRVGEIAAAKLLKTSTAAVDPLHRALQGENGIARMRAASLLGVIAAERSVPPLLATLSDRDYLIRDEAALALSRIGSESAVRPLIDALRDCNADVREGAAWVLGEMKADSAVDPLIAMLNDRECGWMAALSLGKIGAAGAVEPLAAMLRGDDIKKRRASVWALAKIKSDRCRQPLSEALCDRDPEVRLLAVLALERHHIMVRMPKE